jgi:hypothetical protein
MRFPSKIRLLVAGGLLAALVRRVVVRLRPGSGVADSQNVTTDALRPAYAEAPRDALSGDDARPA